MQNHNIESHLNFPQKLNERAVKAILKSVMLGINTACSYISYYKVFYTVTEAEEVRIGRRRLQCH